MHPSANLQQGNWTKNSSGYQILLVVLLSLNFGIVFFDRQALNVLMPQVKPELGLTDTQIGIIAGGLSFTWAIAAFFVGKLSDSLGKRKLLLIFSTIAFSACSFLTGLATTFALLLGARLLMGAAEGGVMPISHAMVASEVSPQYRGLAQGVAQNLGSNLLGSFAAPVILVAFAAAFGWREAFFLAGAPGIISAMIIWFLLKEPAPLPKPTQQEAGMTIPEALKHRNMWVSVTVGILMVGHFVITWSFMPLYLQDHRGMDGETMSWLMGSLGIAAAIYSIVISGLSDRIGRKPVMVILPFLSVVGPLAAIYFTGSPVVLAAIFFVGWAVNGIFPIFMATIPSESFDPRHHATVLGLAMGSCEIIGGVAGPPLAGKLNDMFGPNSFLWMLIVLALISGVVATFLRETAPAVLAKRNGAIPA
ncbi:MFS transporter [Altererythrobacter xixiisoli]|uniref:MFS transporter n=1 Tax=Croceibacterium xixiisoli TaxID=1476466 RepID=A0A6I4TPJ1_9SPHN|nr:MFS transporter [Croceibacterium xixiisoli]MXO98025.1 MFS transporter [Croceibacterium xixiisoli]